MVVRSVHRQPESPGDIDQAGISHFKIGPGIYTVCLQALIIALLLPRCRDTYTYIRINARKLNFLPHFNTHRALTVRYFCTDHYQF